MTEEIRRDLLELAEGYRKNKPRVEKKLQKAGLKADPAVVFSFALYYDCFNRLANE